MGIINGSYAYINIYIYIHREYHNRWKFLNWELIMSSMFSDFGIYKLEYLRMGMTPTMGIY